MGTQPWDMLKISRWFHCVGRIENCWAAGKLFFLQGQGMGKLALHPHHLPFNSLFWLSLCFICSLFLSLWLYPSVSVSLLLLLFLSLFLQTLLFTVSLERSQRPWEEIEPLPHTSLESLHVWGHDWNHTALQWKAEAARWEARAGMTRPVGP